MLSEVEERIREERIAQEKKKEQNREEAGMAVFGAIGTVVFAIVFLENNTETSIVFYVLLNIFGFVSGFALGVLVYTFVFGFGVQLLIEREEYKKYLLILTAVFIILATILGAFNKL